MANLTDHTYFKGDINLPASVLEGNYEVINAYISQYEPEVLKMLLGYDLYKALKVQIDAETYSAPWKAFIEGAEYTVDTDYKVKWNGLVNSEKKSFIAYYVFYQYMRDTVTSTSGVGEVLNSAENATRIAAIDKMSYAYNRFVDLYGTLRDGSFIPSAYRYLYENESSFDLWLFEPVTKVNSFGI